MKYRTIVADPPWEVRRSSGYAWRKGRASGQRLEMPYLMMGLSEIESLPVSTLAERDAHLYLWTIQSKLREAYYVMERWGFHTSCALVWCKGPAGVPGGTYCSTTEFVLFGRRGVLPSKCRIPRQWFEWPRGEHSEKPDGFMDMVEQVSPGPYLELFARRQRLGWDTWGNEALNHVQLDTEGAA